MPRLSQDPANLLPRILTPGGSASGRRVQSVNTTGDRPATDERELGNESIVGTTFDTPQVTLDVEANLVGGRLLSQVANFDPDSTYSGASLLAMLGNQDIDLMMTQRNAARTDFVQAVYVKQAGIGSYTMRAATNASATETFNLTSTNKTAFERYVAVENLISDGTNEVVISGSPIALTKGISAGDNLITLAYAQPSGSSVYLLEGDDYSINPGTGVITLSGTHADAMVSGSTQILISYQLSGTTPAGDAFDAKDEESLAAIRGYFGIPVEITVSSTNVRTRGVQSVEATVNFGIQTEVGMGNQQVGYFRNTPAEVTGNFTIFSENWNIESLMQDGELDAEATDFPIDAWRDDIVIMLNFTDQRTGDIKRTDVLSGLTISNDAKEVRVGQAVGKQYSFRGSTGFDWLIDKVA